MILLCAAAVAAYLCLRARGRAPVPVKKGSAKKRGAAAKQEEPGKREYVSNPLHSASNPSSPVSPRALTLSRSNSREKL